MISTDYHPNFYYVARILAERKYGSQDSWVLELDNAVEIILLIEQLGFLNKKKFWKNDNNQRTTLE
jgi:hypothetical protein